MFPSKIIGKISSKFCIKSPVLFQINLDSCVRVKPSICNHSDKASGLNEGDKVSMDKNRVDSLEQINTCINYHKENEMAVNEQILAELQACYTYLAIAMHFGRTEVALPGLFAFFFKMHLEELGHAHILMRYQLKRGGKLQLCALEAPQSEEWTIGKSLEQGYQMEHQIKQQLTCVAETAAKHKDLSLEDFIVSKFLHAQDDSIRDFGRLIQRYTDMKKGKCSCAVADYLFDKQMHSLFVKTTAEGEGLGLTDCEKMYI